MAVLNKLGNLKSWLLSKKKGISNMWLYYEYVIAVEHAKPAV